MRTEAPEATLNQESYLARLRKKEGLTQKQLGEKIGLPSTYGQKKISQWESNLASPDGEEVGRLAKVLKVPKEQLVGFLIDKTSQTAVELFTRLSTSDRSSLLAVCYSGRPRMLSDPLIRGKYEKALQKSLFVAMFVPYPLVSAETNLGANLLLAGYYTRVWGGVFATRERLRSVIGRKELDKHLAIYGPRHGSKSTVAVIPPFVSRYSLLLESNEGGDFNKSLYLAVETADNKHLELIGNDSDKNASDQIQDWEAFFSGVTNSWMKNQVLPNQDCGYWQYVDGPSEKG